MRVYNKDSFYRSWDLGSTLWVVNSSGDGKIVFDRKNFDDRDTLFKELKPYINDRKKYDVRSNYII